MKNKKIGFLIILIISVLLFLSSNVVSSTTIGDSSVSVEEGEVYTWQWNYIHFAFRPFTSIREGDTVKFTIEKIYSGAYQSINHALLMNITIEENMSGGTTITDRPAYVAYNKSLNFIKLQSHDSIRPFPMIIPIPLNFTLIAEYYESLGETCTIEGSTLIFVRSNMTDEYTFNSDGILTEYVYINSDNLAMRMVLMGGDNITLIIIAVVSIAGGIGVAGVSIYLLRKRKRAREGK